MTVEDGDTLQEAIRADDAGGAVSINRVAGDNWIGFDAARNLISGSPPGIGTYTITLRAEDLSGNYADHTISVIVEDTTPPAWASLPPGTISAQQNVELTFFLDDYISDRNGPYMLSYTKVAGPAWISVTPFAGMFVLSGTPTMTGAFEVVVEATDMYGNSSTATIPGTIHP